MREEEWEFFNLPFRWLYLLDSLCLRDKKKRSQNKKKNPFWFKIFLPIAVEEKEKKEQYTHQANSNLPDESIAREKEHYFL